MKKYYVDAKVKVGLTSEDIEDLVVTALCGGIGYWACLDNSRPEYESQPEDEPVDAWTAKILMDGGTVYFLDEEDHGTVWELTLEKLLNGVKLYIEEGYDRYDAFTPGNVEMGSIDAECADMIFQLALFEELVFG